MYYIIGGIAAAYLAFMQVCGWFIYIKMGEPGWVSLIPIHRTLVFYENVWGPNKHLIFSVPLFLGAVFLAINDWWSWALAFALWTWCIESYIWCTIKLAKATGHSAWFGVGLILLSPVCVPILAFTN